MPLGYQFFFIDSDYKNLMTASQIIYVVANFVKFALAIGWTQQLGLPNFPVYFVSGALASSFEHSLMLMPAHIIVSKLIPGGVESTMMAVSHTIINLNAFTLRSFMGVWIN